MRPLRRLHRARTTSIRSARERRSGILTEERAADAAGLVRRFGLPSPAAAQLDALVDVLATDTLAPTAVRDRGRILDDHLADSLVALELQILQGARRVVDLGSGAGFPGLPLAIALPRVDFVLVESASRKADFIAHAARACGLENVRVAHARIESWEEGLGTCDAVLARAVAPLEVVVEYAAPVLALGGNLIAWRGRRHVEAEDRATRAGHLLGLLPAGVHRVRPYSGARDRYLHLFSKVMETPPGYPRRPGVARKRPLGAR